MTWHADNPKTNGRYLVVDKVYQTESVATYNVAIGWCILGRWRGHDAVELWHDLPELPKREKRRG